jgi:hypothetical protein
MLLADGPVDLVDLIKKVGTPAAFPADSGMAHPAFFRS